MSNALAIAATTATLQQLLQTGVPVRDPDLPGLTVTTLPLDAARPTNGQASLQLNLFLYQTVLSGTWRNQDIPRQVRPGETGQPPLALNLFYLITPFGAADGQRGDLGHRMLGAAMSVLHDHMVLSAAEIQNSRIQDTRGASDLQTQIEHIRITSQPMSVEEISKLWTAFQTNYRLSAAYEVSVVLIDSLRATKAPLPVLTRGQDDSGISARASLTPPFPHLDSATPPDDQTSARLGDPVAVAGSNLGGANIGVRFSNPLLAAGIELAPDPGATDTGLSVKLPDTPAAWPAGFYTVAVLVQRPKEPSRRETNEVSLSLAPRITGIAPNPAPRDANGAVSLTLTLSPEVRPEQRASLLLGDREIPAERRTGQGPQVAFVVHDAVPGEFYVRVRIDGVDSLLVIPKSAPPQFDQTQRLRIA